MSHIEMISEKCIECKLCQKECAFLRKYGKPKAIADVYDPDDPAQQIMAFECSLCELCAAVCPVNVNPAHMFLEMRREMVHRGRGNYRCHSVILGYEKRGISRRYTYYGFPEGCDTILFPGCALPGSRPDKVIKLFEHMKKTIPALGIVLDCCAKPSYSLGRQDYFEAVFSEMRTFLVENGIRTVLAGCPSCYRVFRKYGKDLSVRTVYEFLAENELPAARQVSGSVALQDPCVMRFDETVQAAVRNLAGRVGLTIEEMPHSGKRTLCCGEGGSVSFLNPELAKAWSVQRREEAGAQTIVGYCTGCTKFLSSVAPTSHILDFLFEPEAALAGRAKVSKAPMTYWNRMRLKKYFRKTIKASVSRERTFKPQERNHR